MADKLPSTGKVRYTAYFLPQDDGGYAVIFPTIPEIVTAGITLDDARAMAVDALRCHLEGLRKDGLPFPPPGDPARGGMIVDQIRLDLDDAVPSGTLTN